MIPLETRSTFKDRLRGRSLSVPDGDGRLIRIKSTTLKRGTAISSSHRTLFNVSDYGTGDLAFAEVGIRIDEQDRRGRILRHRDVSVDPFATASTGFVIEQLGLHGNNPEGTIIFSNTAPRGDKKTGEVIWEGEDEKTDHRFVFGVLENGVPVLAVNTGHNLSFVKNHFSGLWVVNVPNNGTQFRSRDNYPKAFDILEGRRGRSLIGEEIDPKTIEDPPVLKIFPDGRLSLPVAYKDGYGNLKTAVRKNDFPPELTGVRSFEIETEGVTFPVVNSLSGELVKEGDLFITTGSSGPKDDPYLEVNQMFGSAAHKLGVEKVTDHTQIVFQAA